MGYYIQSICHLNLNIYLINRFHIPHGFEAYRILNFYYVPMFKKKFHPNVRNVPVNVVVIVPKYPVSNRIPITINNATLILFYFDTFTIFYCGR